MQGSQDQGGHNQRYFEHILLHFPNYDFIGGQLLRMKRFRECESLMRKNIPLCKEENAKHQLEQAKDVLKLARDRVCL